MAPQPPELMEELVEEVLLRIPPEDPATLVHTALVCKLWCRLVCSTVFHRRFHEFNRHAPPLLGLLYNDSCLIRIRIGDTDPCMKMVVHGPTQIAYFVPTTSFRPTAAGRNHWRAIDARHGRVLLHMLGSLTMKYFSVWDPITDKQRDLPKLPFDLRGYSWNAAVTCAAAAGSDCDHLDCRRGPFLVVVMDIHDNNLYLSIYSSEAGAWSKPAICERPFVNSRMFNVPGVLVQSAFYFLVHFNSGIVKYDLATRKVSTIPLPSEVHHLKGSIVLMADDVGELGFVANVKYKLNLWSRVASADVDAGFVLSRVIDLQNVLPSDALIKTKPQLNGFTDGGASRFLFIRTSDGLYSIKISSSQVRKVAGYCGDDDIVPYISFCTPTSRLQH